MKFTAQYVDWIINKCSFCGQKSHFAVNTDHYGRSPMLVCAKCGR